MTTAEPSPRPEGPEEVITCVECGSTAHLLREPRPDEPPEPGDVFPYRCSGCGARWDVVYEPE